MVRAPGLNDYKGVSIRSRPGGREERPRTSATGSASTFQSAPDPEVGRNGTVTGTVTATGRFQSAPDPEVGRNCPRSCRAIATAWFQSAPDPEVGRNPAHQISMSFHYSFNPLPTRRSGGTRRRRGNSTHIRVSIRSRPGGREEPGRWPCPRPARGFQSAPDPEVGRNWSTAKLAAWFGVFQSAPDPEVGRNWSA